MAEQSPPPPVDIDLCQACGANLWDGEEHHPRCLDFGCPRCGSRSGTCRPDCGVLEQARLEVESEEWPMLDERGRVIEPFEFRRDEE